MNSHHTQKMQKPASTPVARAILVSAALLAMAVTTQAGVFYDFATNANGWSVANSTTSTTPFYQSTFGHPAGSIGITPLYPTGEYPTMTLNDMTFGKTFDITFDWYAVDRNRFQMGGLGLFDSAAFQFSFDPALKAGSWSKVEWKCVGGISTLIINDVVWATNVDQSSKLAASGNKFSAKIWYTGSASLDNFSAAIPEPASLALLALAWAVVLRRRRV